MRISLAAAALAFIAAPASAEVKSSSASHFDIDSRIVVPTNPAQTYEALGRIGAWWNGAHTYSGDAANLRLDLRAGGCFCETLPGGGTVEHMRVIQALPASVLRMSGGLGPLQSEALAGTLTWTLRAVEGGTEITSVYLVAGHGRADLTNLAAPVDGVLREQMERLRAYLAR
jgi:uncharacterized protein YndB with AHSA1/START domain